MVSFLNSTKIFAFIGLNILWIGHPQPGFSSNQLPEKYRRVRTIPESPCQKPKEGASIDLAFMQLYKGPLGRPSRDFKSFFNKTLHLFCFVSNRLTMLPCFSYSLNTCQFIFKDLPYVRLKTGTSNANEVKEGSDVVLECDVDSNPLPHRISWHKNVSKS